jgi:methionyl-tRNA formyltransferase
LALQTQPEEGVTYAAKLTKAECAIDWNTSAWNVHNHIRGLSPFPGAWCLFDPGKGPERLRVLRARRVEGEGMPGALLDMSGRIACGGGAVQLLQVQRSGKGAMTFADFAHGARLEPGFRFG